MKKYLTAIKLLISIGILLFLFYRIDFGLLFGHLLKIRTAIFVTAFAILLIQCGLSTYKWKVILSLDTNEIPYFYLMKSYLICNFISLFLPSSFGGDLYRIYSLKKYDKDYLRNTSSVLFDRITGLFALLTISVLSFAIFSENEVNIRVISLYVSSIILFWIMTTRRVTNYLDKFKAKLIKIPLEILKSFGQYRSKKIILISCLMLSLIFQTNIVILNKIYSVGLHMDVEISYLFSVIPLIYLTEALPFSINGFGLREGSFVFFMQKAGFTAEQGLALGMIVITMRYIFAISIGGSLFFLEMLKTRSNTKKNITEAEN